MKTYKINSTQLLTLPSILGVSQGGIARRIDVTENYMSRHINKGEFALKDFIRLSNEYHIPLSRLIVTNESKVFRIDVMEDEHSWKNITFHPDRLEREIAKRGINYSQISRTLNCSKRTAKTILSDEVPLKRLLAFCNAYAVNLDIFITADNLPKITTSKDEARIRLQYLEAEVARLRTALAMACKKLNSKDVERVRDIVEYGYEQALEQ